MIDLQKPESAGAESAEPNQEEVLRQVYGYAAGLLQNGSSPRKVRQSLIDSGLDAESASIVVDSLLKAKRDAAGKNIIYGALWCVGGTVATLADIGYIFWGAILFGGIQCITGLVNYFRYK